VIPQDLQLAYIDPGSGSLLIQVIVGTILAAPFVLRRQLSRVYDALRRRAWRRGPNRGNEQTAPDH
jgi:hypothetical protein